MSHEAKLSVCDKLLLAAYRVEAEGRTPFTAEDLVVAAWRQCPNTFGLSGYYDTDGNALFPDCNRVFAEIMGSKPIRQRGLLTKVGTKMYRLTESGRSLAKQLERSVSTKCQDKREAKLPVDRPILLELKSLLVSRAVQKVDSAQANAVTFHDACVFWGITPQSKAIELEGRLNHIENMIETTRQALHNGAARFEHGGQVLSLATLDLLERTHRALLVSFEEHLEIIRKRIDQRKA